MGYTGDYIGDYYRSFGYFACVLFAIAKALKYLLQEAPEEHGSRAKQAGCRTGKGMSPYVAPI